MKRNAFKQETQYTARQRRRGATGRGRQRVGVGVKGVTHNTIRTTLSWGSVVAQHKWRYRKSQRQRQRQWQRQWQRQRQRPRQRQSHRPRHRHIYIYVNIHEFLSSPWSYAYNAASAAAYRAAAVAAASRWHHLPRPRAPYGAGAQERASAAYIQTEANEGGERERANVWLRGGKRRLKRCYALLCILQKKKERCSKNFYFRAEKYGSCSTWKFQQREILLSVKEIISLMLCVLLSTHKNIYNCICVCTHNTDYSIRTQQFSILTKFDKAQFLQLLKLTLFLLKKI